MATRSRRLYPAKGRSATDWGRILIPTTDIDASEKQIIATFTLSNPGIGETVRRTRGRFSIISDQSTVTEEQLGAVGFMIASDAAVAVGATAVPGPATDASDDGWFVWEGWTQSSQFTLGVSNAAGGFGAVYEFDSKAMRRVEEGFTIAVIAEGSSIAGCEIGMVVSLLSSRT